MITLKKRIGLLVMLTLMIIGAVAFFMMRPAKAVDDISLSAVEVFNGHYYKLFDEGLTWEQAEEKCESVGGYLTTITSSEEQRFIEDLLSSGTKNNYWLGGYEQANNEWKWITNETFSYNHWALGQPDNYYYDDYLMIYRNKNPIKNGNDFGFWNDIARDGYVPGEDGFFSLSHFGFICEWDVEPIGIIMPPSSIFNINLGQTIVNGPSIDLGKWHFNLFSLDMGIDLGNGLSFKQNVDKDKKTIYQSFGVNESVVDSEGDAYWKGTYKNLKDLVNGFGKRTDRDFYNQFRSCRKWLKQHNMKIGFNMNTDVFGYAEYSYASGQTVFKEGGLVLAVEPSLEWKYRIKETGDICYIKLKITGKFNGKLMLEIEDTNINDPVVRSEILAALNLQLEIGADVVIANAHAGVESELGTKITLATNQQTTLENALQVYLTAKVYAEASAFGFVTSPCEYQFADLQLYPQKKMMKALKVSSDPADFVLLERDYQLGNTLTAIDGNNALGMELKDVYPYGEPKIGTLDNGKMIAVWLNDNGTKSNANRTTLMYSIRNINGTWSTSKPVCESGRSDQTPIIAVEGNKAYLVWNNGAEVFSDDVTLSEFMSKMNLVYAEFDGETESFTDPVILNTEKSEKMELLPTLDVNNGQVTVAWVENSNNDYTMTTGTNTILSRTLTDEWDELQPRSADIGIISSMAVDENALILSKDKDNDTATTDDQTVYRLNTYNQLIECGQGRAIKKIDGTVYAVNNDYHLCAVVDATLTDTGANCAFNYDVVTINGNKQVYFTQANGFKNEVYVTKQENGSWSEVVPFTVYNNFIRSFDCALDQNGNIIMAADKVLIDDDYEVGSAEHPSPYGQTDFIITAMPERYDLAVDPILYHDTENIQGGQSITVTADVTNTSTQPITSMQLTWLDENNAPIGNSFIIEQTIAVGETAEVQTTYTLPDSLTHLKRGLRIEAVGVTEDNYDNNTATMEFGYCDVALSDEKLVKNTDGSGKIQLSVKNIGCETASGVNLTLKENGEQGETLLTKSVSNLKVDEELPVEFVLSKSQMQLADGTDGKLFYIISETVDIENDYVNNRTELVYDDYLCGILKGRSISLNGDIGINYYMTIKDAYANEQTAMKFWKQDRPQNYQIVPFNASDSEVIEGQTCYRFSYSVAAKEMADVVCSQMVVQSGDDWIEGGDVMTYSVKEYAEHMINDPKLTDLLVAMLNYGAAAQNQFGYRTDAPANSILTDKQKEVPSAEISDDYKEVVTVTENAKAELIGNSLVLKSQTQLKYYYTLNDETEKGNLVFVYHQIGSEQLQSMALTYDTSKKMYYGIINDIAAKDLGNMYVGYVADKNDLTTPVSDVCKYGPMSYAINYKNDDNALGALMHAMADYWQKAQIYFQEDN